MALGGMNHSPSQLLTKVGVCRDGKSPDATMAKVTFALKKKELGKGIESARACRWHTDGQEPGIFLMLIGAMGDVVVGLHRHRLDISRQYRVKKTCQEHGEWGIRNGGILLG
jgi:hypothetical protein